MPVAAEGDCSDADGRDARGPPCSATRRRSSSGGFMPE